MEAELRNAIYIGDGVYVTEENYGIWLYTSNGIEITNRIFLEAEVYASLETFAKGRGYGKR